MTAALTTNPPSKDDVELARASGQRLAPYARKGLALTFRVRDAENEEAIELPAGAVKLLMAVLEVSSSIFGCNEAKTFVSIEKLNRASGHKQILDAFTADCRFQKL